MKRVFSFCIVSAMIASAAVPQQAQQPTGWPTLRALLATNESGEPLSSANFSVDELKAVRTATAESTRDYCGGEERGGDAIFRQLLVSRINIRGDGGQAILVEGGGEWDTGSRCLCGVTGNCQMWVLLARGGEANVLLATSGWAHVVLNSSSHGYFDIVTAEREGAATSELTMWRFEGKRYQPLRCASKHYAGTGSLDEQQRTAKIFEHPCKSIP
jgi:hypothetical protein